METQLFIKNIKRSRKELITLFLFLTMVSMFNINCSKLFQNQIEYKHMTRCLIQEVKSDSLKNYDFFILKDIDNNEYVFQQGNSNIIWFSPSHLREHMLLGLPVSVEYYIYDGSYIVINLYD